MVVVMEKEGFEYKAMGECIGILWQLVGDIMTGNWLGYNDRMRINARIEHLRQTL